MISFPCVTMSSKAGTQCSSYIFQESIFPFHLEHTLQIFTDYCPKRKSQTWGHGDECVQSAVMCQQWCKVLGLVRTDGFQCSIRSLECQAGLLPCLCAAFVMLPSSLPL